MMEQAIWFVAGAAFVLAVFGLMACIGVSGRRAELQAAYEQGRADALHEARLAELKEAS